MPGTNDSAIGLDNTVALINNKRLLDVKNVLFNFLFRWSRNPLHMLASLQCLLTSHVP